jgi:antirestriction protein ArdC
VRKGERSTEIVFTKKLKIIDRDTLEDKEIPMLRSFNVFNACQVETGPEMD